ncbi:glycosyltransferase family 2 protein [Peribacillus huizhouensis]|uniref:Glycosyltransferase involved in cell wall biosynthesis n=1 Tax=Peribacillus huizhouensis TaxID=1501239 RepID=A0ABR6CL66_9BACI|nr:glycosyltransferase [Peribacillus huizhouensis]MBA9025659.1 glycosyltransferase involved in cell wall biosynthesis [Peribacillus huizhouensis]
MEKKVSVIIPTYQRINELRMALTSVVNQTYTNIEIIVIDDNEQESEYRDQVQKVINEFSSMKIIFKQNKENLGAARSRNVGIYMASGDYITFLDDDDIYEANKVKRQLNYMLNNDLEMCFTDLILKNEKQKIVDVRNRENLNEFNQDSLLKYHLMNHLTGTDTFMYKSELLKKIGGFNFIDIGDEFYLMLKTIESGAKIGYLKGSDVIAYVHGQGGLSNGEAKINGENDLYNFKKKYFYLFSTKEKNFIRFRHYSVLAFANFKRKKYLVSIKNIVQASFFNPYYAIKSIPLAVKNFL